MRAEIWRCLFMPVAWCPEPCLAHSTCLINICGVNNYVLETHPYPWGPMESQVTEKVANGPWMERNYLHGGQVPMTLDTISCVSISKGVVSRKMNKCSLRKLVIKRLLSHYHSSPTHLKTFITKEDWYVTCTKVENYKRYKNSTISSGFIY